MPARDIYHDAVRNALLKDGWRITHDPLVLKWGWKDLFIDLGAERLLAAEKDQQKIAVEIKSFTGPSDMADLERALGQYIVYHDVLAEREPERILYRNRSDPSRPARRWVSLSSTHPTKKQSLVGWVEERNPSIGAKSRGDLNGYIVSGDPGRDLARTL